MNLYTIGFTQKSAERFFGLLRGSGARRVIDVRLRPNGQLAGFTRKNDLEYFLPALLGKKHGGYQHLPELAPTSEMLDAYRKEHHDWARYEQEFIALMAERRIEKMPLKRLLSDACLLCSEPGPHHCHRRLVAEYLQRHWGGIEIVHLT